MDTAEFRRQAHALVDWMADYLEHVEAFPVRSPVVPREVIDRLPSHPPAEGESFDRIFADFREIILPGMTHWQSPNFFAYFPANSSPPSLLAEMLTATLGAQCMSWVTSPAAAELEERMMEWLRDMLGLPAGFTGVIHDTASTATLCALLTAREIRSDFRINQSGFPPSIRFTCYASREAHSSIEKGVKIAGIGRENLRLIPVDDRYGMIPEELERAIVRDREAGHTPLCVVAALGTTGSTAIDPLRPIGEICRRHGLWLHVDAAYAGTALLLPEMRWMAEGVELADSFVVNPHKWMLTNFDCTAYYVKDPAALVRTFAILPEYLKTADGDRVNNYRDWGIQLGRRFRALKLWFVIRSYGVSGIQEILRQQCGLARELESEIKRSGEFEMLAPRTLNLLCFRYHPRGLDDTAELNRLNAELLERVNRSGKAYCTHTTLDGRYTIRMVIGQVHVGRRNVEQAWALFRAEAAMLRGRP